MSHEIHPINDPTIMNNLTSETPALGNAAVGAKAPARDNQKEIRGLGFFEPTA